LILLIDDDPDILEACGIVLEAQNFHVLSCRSGEEALQTFRIHQEEINTVITDYHMPNMDGLELIQSIRMQQPKIHTILISGAFDQELPNNIILLKKPFSMDVLIQAVEQSAN
jgi:DNA-binding NtrC family response regulator